MSESLDLIAVMRRIAREEAERVMAEQRPAPVDASAVVSIPTAAKMTDYKPASIRKMVYQKRIRNYGRQGAPRVRVAEILNLPPE